MAAPRPGPLRVEADGPVRTVILDRPDERNAIDRELHGALATIWGELAADAEARAVVLTGAGRAFSGGGDLTWITSFLDDADERDHSLREAAVIIEELLTFPLPVIAAVNGAAVGLGCSIAVLCDVVLMADHAYLCDPHVSVGLVAGDGGAAFWPRLAPPLRIREALFTGDRIPAAHAVEIGLATRTVPGDDLLAEAHRLAHRLAAQPAEALQATKRIANAPLLAAMADAVPAGLAAEAETMRSADHRRLLAALTAPKAP